jgi:hypothetical protein
MISQRSAPSQKQMKKRAAQGDKTYHAAMSLPFDYSHWLSPLMIVLNEPWIAGEECLSCMHRKLGNEKKIVQWQYQYYCNDLVRNLAAQGTSCDVHDTVT